MWEEKRREEGGGAAGPLAGQHRKGEKKEGRADSRAGLKMKEGRIFQKQNLFQFYFSILSQIQIEFEFNFKSSSPTLNQKPYAST